MTANSNTTKRNALRTLAAASLVSALGATTAFAAECTPSALTPTNLTQLRTNLLPRMSYATSIQLGNEGFTAPAPQLKFTNVDTTTGNFSGQIVFSPIKTYSISGKLTHNGGANFSISFTYRPLVGVTNTYTGAIRAFNDADCMLRYHIAGVYTSTSLSVLTPKFGPAPFSGAGYTVFLGG